MVRSTPSMDGQAHLPPTLGSLTIAAPWLRQRQPEVAVDFWQSPVRAAFGKEDHTLSICWWNERHDGQCFELRVATSMGLHPLFRV